MQLFVVGGYMVINHYPPDKPTTTKDQKAFAYSHKVDILRVYIYQVILVSVLCDGCYKTNMSSPYKDALLTTTKKNSIVTK